MKRIIQNFTLTTTLTLALGLTAQAEYWDGSNSPSIFESDYEYRFDALPMKGSVPSEKTPWSETYWPSEKGSINYRWNSPNPVGFDYYSPNADQVKSMSMAELARLSPAEKYDLAMGRYDYPLKSEVRASSSPRAKDWAGICHGWAPAAHQFSEPKPVVFTNPDGIQIPFGSSDVKGLLSYFMAFHAELDTVQIGLRCYRGSRIFRNAHCKDVNPGALHVVLANEIGLRKKGFNVDIDWKHEIWNQPVYAFESQVVGSASSRNAYRAVRVKTKMRYADELDVSEWEPVMGTDKFQFADQEMEYILELDSAGRIVGGEWITSKVHPDFLWKSRNEPGFSGQFQGLEKIYQPAAF